MGTIISTLSNDEFYADEVNGEIVETKAVFFVKMASLSGFQDALDTTGVPQPNDPYNNDNPWCKVARRVVSYHPRKTGGPLAKIEVYYELQRPADATGAVPDTTSITSGSVNLSQEKTQVDVFGTAITVEHAGDTQGADVDYLRPKSSITFQTTEVTDSPDTVAIPYVGKTNSGAWRGGAKGTWLCSDCSYRLVDGKSSPARYEFDWSFEYDSLGHDPDVWYIDTATNRPPEGLVDGTGIKTVQVYEQTDFSSKFKSS